MQIDRFKFLQLHQTFLEHLLQEAGVTFQQFDHPLLVDEEISYKYEAVRKGRSALKLERWPTWKRKPGRILSATREACSAENSANLLSAPRYGPEKGSSGALYRVGSTEEILGLEEALFDLLAGGPASPREFGPRFDRFASYLRDNHLGCNWRFTAYLAFLLQHQIYLPVLPSKFDPLLTYFDSPFKFSGKVTWDRYAQLLELGEALADELGQYGRPNSIEVQSYMYVAASLLDQLSDTVSEPPLDPKAELDRRQKKAVERERIGLLGEIFVLENERQSLQEEGRSDLARRVKLISTERGSSGYDVLSFTSSGEERHIEVKTTTRSGDLDIGFWLTGNEKDVAERDPLWTIIRVSNATTVPEIKELGNLIRSASSDWNLNVYSWFVEKPAS